MLCMGVWHRMTSIENFSCAEKLRKEAFKSIVNVAIHAEI